MANQNFSLAGLTRSLIFSSVIVICLIVLSSGLPQAPEADYLDAAVVSVLQIHLTQPAGDILVSPIQSTGHSVAFPSVCLSVCLLVRL